VAVGTYADTFFVKSPWLVMHALNYM
jgi:hypothetical protein